MNRNKIRGLLAEVALRGYLSDLGFGDRTSPGGWIARSKAPDIFGANTVVVFPEVIVPGRSYTGNYLSEPSHGLHTICATFHQCGIQSFYCSPIIADNDIADSVYWNFVRLGLPTEQRYQRFPFQLDGFSRRERRYNYLRYNSDTTLILDEHIPEEFSKEHLRVSFSDAYKAEMSDIDGIFWGQQFTYPLEIKEKTAGESADMGPYFGLDVGPFVKLAFFAAKRGNLHSLFIVREINDETERGLVNWWFIKFETMAQYASWVFRSGGRGMTGGNSAVVRIPKEQFALLNAENLRQL